MREMWLSTDPLQEKYPNKTTYHFCSNNPIGKVDPDGRGDYYNQDGIRLGSDKIADDKTYAVSFIDEESARKGLSATDLLNMRDREHLGSTDPMVYELPMKHSEFKAVAGTINSLGNNF